MVDGNVVVKLLVICVGRVDVKEVSLELEQILVIMLFNFVSKFRSFNLYLLLEVVLKFEIQFLVFYLGLFVLNVQYFFLQKAQFFQL